MLILNDETYTETQTDIERNDVHQTANVLFRLNSSLNNSRHFP